MAHPHDYLFRQTFRDEDMSEQDKQTLRLFEASKVQAARNAARGGFHITGVSVNPEYWLTPRGQQEIAQRFGTGEGGAAGQGATHRPATYDNPMVEGEVSRAQVTDKGGIFQPNEAYVRDARAIADSPNLTAEQKSRALSALLAEAGGPALQSTAGARGQVSPQGGLIGADRKKLLRAQRVVGTLHTMFQGPNKEINRKQLTQALDDARGEFGDAVLMQVPEWRELTGSESAYQQAIALEKQKYAEKRGIDVDMVQWDSEQGRATANIEELRIQAAIAQARATEAKPLMDFQTEQRRLAREEYEAEISGIEKEFSVLKGTTGGEALSVTRARTQRQEAFQRYQNKLIDIAEGRRTAAQQQQPGQTPVVETPQAPRITHPTLPGVAAFGSFATPAEAASTPAGQYAVIDNKWFRRGLDGRWSVVE